MELKNKVVLVTGSSTGIGKAIAIRFAKEGSKLIINYHKSKNLGEETLKEVRKMGVEAILVKADVSKPQDVAKLFKKSLEKFKRVDILINNAALAEEKVPFMKASYSDILQMINTDLISVLVCSQHAVKIMQKQGSGKIINTSSVRGIDYMGTVGTVVYSSAKAGVSNFTKTLAKLVAPKIHVNAIAPGYVKTRGYDGLTKKELNRRIQLTQLKRFIRTEEIADAFVFLAKNDAMTGQIIPVDAGLTLK